MFVRVAQGRRPRRAAALAIGASLLVAAGLVASVVLAALVSDNGTYSVQVDDRFHSSPLVSLGNASVEYIGSDAANQASGTGLFDPFVRLQAAPTERGYNTDGPVQFNEKTGTWTHAILVSAIPVVDCDAGGPGTASCWELFNDINDSNTAKYISLTDVEIWFTTNPNLVGYVDPTGFPAPATQEYDFSGEIKIHDVNQGSGRGDLRFLVPIAGHQYTASTYFVLYSKWGSPDVAPDGKTYASEGGFEEWKVRKAPNVTILKTANPPGPVTAGDSIGFDISISNTGPADATNVTINDPLPGGSDLDWSLDPAFTGCSIGGVVGAQVLTCTFATLGAGDTIGPIHVTSATTAADCARVSNTATVASGNDGGGQSSAFVDVQCGALVIEKRSTKTDNPFVSTAGAEFCYSMTSGCSVTNITDNGTGDQDTGTAGIGSVCVSGLAPGTYYVNETKAPPGYGDASGSNVAVTVVNGTDCSAAHRPAAAATATFLNSPLADIQVNFRDGGSDETSATISCDNADGSQDLTPASGWDTSDTETGISAPVTVICTITIDP